MAGAELADRGVRVLEPPQPDGGEEHGRRPALGPVVQELDVIGVQGDPVAFDEELARLGGRERQLVGAQLGEVAGGAQPRQAERRVRAGQGDEPEVGRQTPQRVRERGQWVGLGHRLKVVEHEVDRAAVRGDPVHQLVDRPFDQAGVCAEPAERAPPEVGADAVDRGREVRPQAHRVVVARIERDPGERRVAVRGPGPHRGRLAVSGGGGHERERGALAGVEGACEPRPLHQPGPWPRGCELRRGERHPRRTGEGRGGAGLVRRHRPFKLPTPATRAPTRHAGHRPNRVKGSGRARRAGQSPGVPAACGPDALGTVTGRGWNGWCSRSPP